ncbi:ADP-ribosylglycohydrolase family protein [Mycolicibacterium arseniciresistens]|uniref:ADP-ribosylglycohydrolase family protein n=1 Tax=Mycolicibacterium arseniciresistens TaxID=3062257 RepID=A0ABT8UBC5_9MYCO|nr:ADP-ribosylglycohydrolase family protein [Mycolicibacterium arseniciresistens]MDO3635093.1 ADP-ribosylglycohydrolase family protein [Mycolicibacterium arseniciresistens]
MTALEDRIRAALVAFGVGDATGVPWEGYRPAAIDPGAVAEVPRRAGWPPGATSDDTALMLLVADYLADRGAHVDERDFLTRLAEAVPGIRGIGPSTHAAVERFGATGGLRARTGDTNGAAMRALPIGGGIPTAAAGLRRRVVTRLSRTTHGAAGAVGAACVVTAMAATAVEAPAIDAVLEAASAEVRYLRGRFAKPDTVWAPLSAAVAGDWRPGRDGVSLDGIETAAAVITVVRRTGQRRRGLADAVRDAVMLGGDTDTVAALACGILGGLGDIDMDIPWWPRLALPEPGRLDRSAAALAALRATLA